MMRAHTMTQTRMSHQVACLPSDTAPHIHLIFTYARSVSKCSAHFVLLFYPLLSCQSDRQAHERSTPRFERRSS